MMGGMRKAEPIEEGEHDAVGVTREDGPQCDPQYSQSRFIDDNLCFNESGPAEFYEEENYNMDFEGESNDCLLLGQINSPLQESESVELNCRFPAIFLLED